MGRLQRSWALTQQSLSVLRANPSLIAFPVISSIATLIVSASFFVPLYLVFGEQAVSNEKLPIGAYPFLFLFYVVSYFVVIFFNAALVHCARETLGGRPASVSDGLTAATSRILPILGWAVISATVGVILRTISERVGIIGKLVVGLFGAAWSVLTFFVVPSLVLDKVGPVEAIKRSGSTLKRTWGEALIGGAGIGLAIGLLALVPIPLIVGAAFTSMAALIIGVIVISILYWIALATVGSSLQGIYTTAVYTYAYSGTVPAGFSEDAIQNAFESKPGTLDKVRNRFR
jgi:hypothetical protein